MIKIMFTTGHEKPKRMRFGQHARFYSDAIISSKAVI